MATPFVSGWARRTTSGIIGDSGKAQYFSGYVVESGAGGAAIPYFLNGSTGTGALAFRGAGGAASSGGIIQQVGQLPVTFTNGIYVSFDANTTAVSVFYAQALT
jgi:hypothetical protein